MRDAKSLFPFVGVICATLFSLITGLWKYKAQDELTIELCDKRCRLPFRQSLYTFPRFGPINIFQ